MKKLTFSMVLFGIFALLTARTSSATILGQVWENVSTSISQDALIANAPMANTGAYAEFSPSAINYDSNVTGYTVSTFLNSPTFSNTTVSFSPTADLNNTYILFTGQTYLNAGANSFVTPHDDGFELLVNGAFNDALLTSPFDLQEPGPTAAVNTPYTIYAATSGLYDFTLAYGECCGPPAVLGFQVNGQSVGNVPEPESLYLMGIGLVGFLFGKRHRAV